LLDRLVDAEPSEQSDRPLSAAGAMDTLRASICRDLEELLNTRRRWRSWDPNLTELERSLVGYGLPDFASGAFNDPRRREELRLLIEACIGRFEPRIAGLRVTLLEAADRVSGTLRLRIDALLRAEPAPEPIAFDTVVDLLTKNVTILEKET
jgi:type VI secretion system protein ImpF